MAAGLRPRFCHEHEQVIHEVGGFLGDSLAGTRTRGVVLRCQQHLGGFFGHLAGDGVDTAVEE